MVADHDREVLAPSPRGEAAVQRGPAAARVGAVRDVVVDEQEGVQELHADREGPEPFRHGSLAAREPVADRQQGGPQSLRGPERVVPRLLQRTPPACLECALRRQLEDPPESSLEVGLEVREPRRVIEPIRPCLLGCVHEGVV